MPSQSVAINNKIQFKFFYYVVGKTLIIMGARVKQSEF